MKIQEILLENKYEQEAEAYRNQLIKTLPKIMRFYEKNIEGWKPSKEQMLAAVETGYTVMKHTGDVKQAGKAVMDELNTLFRLSQGQDQVSELFEPGKNWEWSFKGSEEAVADFHVGEIPYQFYAYRPSADQMAWDVEFKNAARGKDRASKFGLTGTGNSAEVMSTVTDIMRAFLKEYQGRVTSLTFTAKEPSRRSLYARMIKRLLPSWNITQDDDSDNTRFTITAPAKSISK
jgi:hypothetical protein